MYFSADKYVSCSYVPHTITANPSERVFSQIHSQKKAFHLQDLSINKGRRCCCLSITEGTTFGLPYLFTSI